MDDLRERYDASKHPDVLLGTKSPEQVCKHCDVLHSANCVQYNNTVMAHPDPHLCDMLSRCWVSS
jgi:hypothetical protein